MLPKYPKHKRLKEKRFTDAKHLNAIRQLPCCVCGLDRSDMDSASHHLMDGMIRGTGLKAGDNWAIPLCHQVHHPGLHQHGAETAYLEAHGVKHASDLAKALYKATGSYEAMLAVLWEHGK